jgi:hypothetical protein
MLRGTSDLDLIRSGLDDTMRMAFHDSLETHRKNLQINGYRTVACAIAITRWPGPATNRAWPPGKAPGWARAINQARCSIDGG